MFFRKLIQTGKFMPLVLIALSGALFLQTAAPVQAEEVRRFFIKNLDNKRFDTRDQKGGPFVMSFFSQPAFPVTVKFRNCTLSCQRSFRMYPCFLLIRLR